MYIYKFYIYVFIIELHLRSPYDLFMNSHFCCICIYFCSYFLHIDISIYPYNMDVNDYKKNCILKTFSCYFYLYEYACINVCMITYFNLYSVTVLSIINHLNYSYIYSCSFKVYITAEISNLVTMFLILSKRLSVGGIRM
jgi:hypothetical protein